MHLVGCTLRIYHGVFCPWKLPDWSKTEPHSSSHSAMTCHKIGKRNTQNQCRSKHSYDGNELALCKTKLIYYSCREISHAYTMCHLYMWLPLQTFIPNRISTVMSLLDRFLCIRSPRHVTGKNGSKWRGLSTHLTGLVLAAARQELQEFSSAVHVQSLRSCEAAGIFCYFVYRYICVTSILYRDTSANEWSC